jgi:CHASE2 domain-containing sensor protein
MVAIIVYGLIFGIILFGLRSTRNIGTLVLAIVGILFVGTSILLLLGEAIMALMPVIIIVAVIYVIYRIATRGKDIQEQKASMEISEEERKAREEALKDLL